MAYIDKKPPIETIFDCLDAFLQTYRTESPAKHSYITGQVQGLLQVLNSADLRAAIGSTIARLNQIAERYHSVMPTATLLYFTETIRNLEADARDVRDNVRRIGSR